MVVLFSAAVTAGRTASAAAAAASAWTASSAAAAAAGTASSAAAAAAGTASSAAAAADRMVPVDAAAGVNALFANFAFEVEAVMVVVVAMNAGSETAAVGASSIVAATLYDSL